MSSLTCYKDEKNNSNWKNCYNSSNNIHFNYPPLNQLTILSKNNNVVKNNIIILSSIFIFFNLYFRWILYVKICYSSIHQDHV